MPKGKPGSWQHGTVGGYKPCRKQNGEACAGCRGAHSDWLKDYRALTSRQARRSAPGIAPIQYEKIYAKGDTLEDLLEAW